MMQGKPFCIKTGRPRRNSEIIFPETPCAKTQVEAHGIPGNPDRVKLYNVNEFKRS